MPTYTYQCKICGEKEIKQSIKENKLIECPDCKSDQFERLINNGNFILNGGGWYKDGYSGKKN